MCRPNAAGRAWGDACLTLRQESIDAAFCDLKVSTDGAVQVRAARARWERKVASLRLPCVATPPRRAAAAGKHSVRTACGEPAADRGNVDLNGVLAETRRTLGDLVGERIELNVVPAAERAGAAAAPARLRTLLRDLVGEACRGMPYGGRLTIETAQTVLDAEFCASHGRCQPGTYLMLALTVECRVGSTGKHERCRIESPAPAPHGRLADAIVQRAGGCICRHRGAAGGNTTEVFLPGGSEPQAPAPSAYGSRSLPRGFETVLVVCSDRETRAGAVRLLETLGYTVLEAAGPIEARGTAERFRGPIHLVLWGPACPARGAGKLLRSVQRASPEAALLRVDGPAGEVSAGNGSAGEGEGFVAAAHTQEALAREVRRLLDRHGHNFLV